MKQPKALRKKMGIRLSHHKVLKLSRKMLVLVEPLQIWTQQDMQQTIKDTTQKDASSSCCSLYILEAPLAPSRWKDKIWGLVFYC